MERNLMFFYDEEGDILDISIGKPKKAISREIKEDFMIRVDPNTNRVVGFMIFNFVKGFKKNDKTEVPIEAMFELVTESSDSGTFGKQSFPQVS